MLKVLIVEDDADDCESICELVQDLGHKTGQVFSVEHVQSAEAARERARYAHFDLFIVDYYLAGSTGLDFVRDLRAFGRLPPVVLVSGRDTISMPVEVMDWMSRGELTFLPKSDLNQQAFEEVLRIALGRELKVLLVDDDEEEFHLTRTYLRLSPFYRFNVQWVSNLPEARERIQRQEYDVILVDYMLGEESGADFIQEMIAQSLQTPLVLFSAQETLQANEDMVRMIGRRKLSFLAKEKMSTETLTRVLVHTLN